MFKLKEKAMGLIGGSEVLAYSFAIFGSSMVSALLGSALSFFYTEVLFLSTAAVGAIFLVARIWDAVNDPVMGILVDRTHTKWGKCVPYLRYAPIPLFFISVFMFLPIVSLSPLTKTILAGIFYVLFDAVFTAVEIPLQGLQPLLFIDQQERNKAVSVSSTLGSTGTILPGGLYFALVLLVGGSEKSPMGNFAVATTLIGIGCLCMMISSRFLKEKITPPAVHGKRLSQTFKPLLKNQPLMILLLTSLLSSPTNMVGNALVYFCTWNYADTGLSTAFLFPLLQISSGASWMLSILCVPFLLKHFSKKKLFLAMCVAGALINIGLFLIGYQNIWFYMIVKFFANFPAGIIATLNNLMISDSIEYAEWKTGERSEGVTFSAIKLIGKVSGAGMSALTMFTLGLVRYDSKAMQATLEAGLSIAGTYSRVLNMIYMLMTLSAAVAFVMQIIPMLFYKFQGNFQEQVLEELKERRAAAQELG
ncbi:MAG: glycoside-pentoside-hexuronide (GPH):cation symporter [Oscillospiraceae bacterium]|nr:glycoside-pentoside-hexuronide (GPH):cation symporter [Oscillospiraceae bacterium]